LPGPSPHFICLVSQYVDSKAERSTQRGTPPRGIARSDPLRRTDRFHTAVSIVSLIVVYFSATRVLQLLGHSDAFSARNLKLRKAEVLDFVRHAVFVNPDAPVL
jgi:hypothetical protein